MPIVRSYGAGPRFPQLGNGPGFQPSPTGPRVRPYPVASFDKLKGKKKIKKSGVYKLKKGETVTGKKKSDTKAFVAGRKA